MEAMLKRQQETIEARSAELGTPLQSQLSPAEQAELHKTNDELVQLKERAATSAQVRSKVRTLLLSSFVANSPSPPLSTKHILGKLKETQGRVAILLSLYDCSVSLCSYLGR
jgi:hypothetical protein